MRFPLYKSLIVASILVSISAQSIAQKDIIRKLLPDTTLDCRDVQYACMQMIPLYYTDRQFDTAYALLDFWKEKCGMDETIFRTKILFDIDNGSFNDSILEKYNFVRYLDIYSRLAADTGEVILNDYPGYYVFEPELLYWYKSFTDTLAYRCAGYTDLSATEHFLVSWYVKPADSLFKMIIKREYEGTTLRKRLERPVHGYIPDLQLHYSLNAGIWIPYKNLELLGIHPSVGGQAGIKYGRYLGDLSIDIRFGKSPNDYKVKIDEEVRETHQFTNISIRLDGGYEILNWLNTELIFSPGIGVDQIVAVNELNNLLDDEDDVTKEVYSFNMNLGGIYRIYLRNNHYLGVAGRYHFLKFKNPGGTKLNGNALTISLEYGLGMNTWQNNRNTILRSRIRNIR